MNEREIEERVRAERAVAAQRTLEILTEWARQHPQGACVLRASLDGKLEIDMGETYEGRLETPFATFRGESLQDACAQAAQTISFNGGSL